MLVPGFRVSDIPTGGVSSGNKKTSQSNSGAKTIPKKKEFWYQLHDGSRGNGYTFEKITQTIISKIQTAFTGGQYIVNSLRAKAKIGPAIPTRGTSTIVDATLKAVEQETLNRKYEAQLAHYFGQEMEFEDNWVKAYGLIFESYCSRDMQIAVRELVDYETRTIDNPLELLIDVEKSMHVPRKAVYPELALLDTISSLLTL